MGPIEPYTIGSSISSGCIRMINQDAIDLFARVAIGTTVHVLGSAPPLGRPVSRQPIPDQAGGRPPYRMPFDPNP